MALLPRGGHYKKSSSFQNEFQNVNTKKKWLPPFTRSISVLNKDNRKQFSVKHSFMFLVKVKIVIYYGFNHFCIQKVLFLRTGRPLLAQ